MLHIVFSHSAEQMLKQAFREKLVPFIGDVLIYEPQLQLGDVTNEEIRLKKWADIYQINTTNTEIQTVIKSFKQAEADVLGAIENHVRIVFWVGETASDELAFLRLIDSFDIGAKVLLLNRIRGSLLVDTLLPGEVDQFFVPVPLSELNQFRDKWGEVCGQGDKLIVREADFVYQFVDYSFYDDQLLLLIPTNESVRMAVIVGEMYGKEPHFPYFFFAWRIYQLAEKGLIEIDGERESIRQTYVRRKSEVENQ